MNATIPRPVWDITVHYVRTIGDEIGIDWDEERFGPDELLRGILVEMEHGPVDPETDITHGDIRETAKIAWVHLNEHPDYYRHLLEAEKAMEDDRMFTPTFIRVRGRLYRRVDARSARRHQ